MCAKDIRRKTKLSWFWLASQRTPLCSRVLTSPMTRYRPWEADGWMHFKSELSLAPEGRNTEDGSLVASSPNGICPCLAKKDREASPTQGKGTGPDTFHRLYRKKIPLPVKEIMFTDNFSSSREAHLSEISKERREEVPWSTTERPRLHISWYTSFTKDQTLWMFCIRLWNVKRDCA